MFKFKLKQTIFYMQDNRVHSAPVLSRMIVENAHDDWTSNKEQITSFTPFGDARTVYNTCHGQIVEADAFASRTELTASL